MHVYIYTHTFFRSVASIDARQSWMWTLQSFALQFYRAGKFPGLTGCFTGLDKCPILGILNIAFKYLLKIISPLFGWKFGNQPRTKQRFWWEDNQTLNGGFFPCHAWLPETKCRIIHEICMIYDIWYMHIWIFGALNWTIDWLIIMDEYTPYQIPMISNPRNISDISQILA